MIRYAYRRKLPTQFLMTFGNEEIFDEKRLHLAWGQIFHLLSETAYYKFSDVYNPTDFEDEGKFVEVIKEKFCEFFDEVCA